MWASNPFFKWAESKYLGFVGRTATAATVVWGQPQMYVDTQALPGFKRTLFAKTSSLPDLAHGLWFADLGWKECEEEIRGWEEGWGEEGPPMGMWYGLCGRPHGGRPKGWCQGWRRGGPGPCPQPTEPSQSTLKTTV